ncbi:beta-glucosidase [Pontibacter sp. E15-1]|uniref:glucoamylase family protein n=1 Tax=Pontibacter sp. E15-1 TaxID=2919918 RepID=UPI001F4FAF27|nr:glucoamylase family protein [Pontibacter sp. E15-1]MCJ8166766.1 beta-glucosidase [Pontibacter sp. E15-1]
MIQKQLLFYCLLLMCALLSCSGDPDKAPVPDPTTDPDTPLTPTTTEDRALLDKVQETTFRYFWDYAHPASGMARERTGSGDLVTSGGTGFGVQAIIVGAQRGWITRAQATERLTKLTDFLATADRFHGVWPHWLNGSTGAVIPFSPKDNGGDLIETSFLMNGLLTARAYFDGAGQEAALRTKITQLWETVEWDWYASRGNGLLYWHWSPNHAWEMNMPIRGWNEGLIAYVLALASPTHAISPEVYQNTWVNASFGQPQDFAGYTLKMGPSYGGPLFFAHYSFLSLDPRQMQDTYTNYWQQNQHHTMVNRSYSLKFAPQGYGYAENFWGLTASDDPDGYAAHSPTNDNGTVAPTAALGSFPYTPYYSMQALRNFYKGFGGRLIGEYGLKDAHNKTRNWTASDHLAIDQGPIVAMIENYRSGLLWGLFTDLPEIQNGLAKAGIRKPTYETGFPLEVPDVFTNQVDLLKHPDRENYFVGVATKEAGVYTLKLLKEDGTEVKTIWNAASKAANGLEQVALGAELVAGKYKLLLSSSATSKEVTLFLH